MDQLGNGAGSRQSWIGSDSARQASSGESGAACEQSASGIASQDDIVTLSPPGSTSRRSRRSISLQDVGNPAAVQGEEKDVVVGTPLTTGYYPADDPVQGGFVDMQDKPLCTLQDHVEGKVPYVSLAFDIELYRTGVITYGDVFSIPELDTKYGKHLTFKSVDTGSAFTGKKFTRIDICCKTRDDTYEPWVNQIVTLIKVGAQTPPSPPPPSDPPSPPPSDPPPPPPPPPPPAPPA